MASEANLRARYAELSDDRLRNIVLHPTDYTQDALRVAEECLRARGLSTEGPEADWTDIRIGREEMDVENAGPGLKIIFFLFPGIGLLVNLIWFILSLFGKSDPRIAQTMSATLLGWMLWSILYWLGLAVSGQWFYYG